MGGWVVERILHFDQGDFVTSGLAHFGFHVRDGHYYAVAHQRHFLGRIDRSDHLAWTVAQRPVFDGVSNITADLEYPMYVDALPDGTLIVSNMGNARLFRVDPRTGTAHLLVDGRKLGMSDMGNGVVDDEGLIWVSEVTGCRVWRFDRDGRTVAQLGDGVAGFDPGVVGSDDVRFGWIYDLRRGPDGRIWVLDSGNYALRVIDVAARTVRTVAGTGTPGYQGDGGDARDASFGSDPTARFDGPISLSLDDEGNAYVGDRHNHVVRMIEGATGIISTIAGRSDVTAEANDPDERDPRRVNLPMISSLDRDGRRLYVPTDLEDDAGDLVVLRKT